MLVHKFIIVTNVMILLNSLVILQHTCGETFQLQASTANTQALEVEG